jgi:hypothetical protein
MAGRVVDRTAGRPPRLPPEEQKMTETDTDPVLRIRLVPDKSDGSQRIKRYDPETGHAYLTDPDTWDRNDPTTWQEKPWPLLGLVLDNKPTSCLVPTSFVAKGIAGGWLELEAVSMVHRPGGPVDDKWRSTHTFTHAKTLTFHTLDGDVVYHIVHQPDKYAVTHRETINEAKGYIIEHVDDDLPVTDDIYAAGDTRVDHFYGLELVNS